MCGLFFVKSSTGNLSQKEMERILSLQSWRGPDCIGSYMAKDNRLYLGHNRLTILDESTAANQPLLSQCGRYRIVFNGEIYNYRALKSKFNLNLNTRSDTEVLLELYAKIGIELLDHIDGMFAFVIVDLLQGSWIAARDHLGIKPLYWADNGSVVAFSSETRLLTELVGEIVDDEQLAIWECTRRPLPGSSFFKGIRELMPGHFVSSDKMKPQCYWKVQPSDKPYEQSKFDSLLQDSVTAHLQNDFSTVGLLSGGIDSALIAALAPEVKKFYTTGLTAANEFEGARETAGLLNRDLEEVVLSESELHQHWRQLLMNRREPLSVPNEGLIYAVCSNMRNEEKVVLTGEGADELLFGYDRIYRWAASDQDFSPMEFMKRYGYRESSNVPPLLIDYIADMKTDKSSIQFVEDFFIHFHLPGLLRRMDSASMVASKEARVPFVNKSLFEYMYRRPSTVKLEKQAKLPARKLATRLGLLGVLNRPKVGFKVVTDSGRSVYDVFREFNLTVLGWI